MYTPPGAPPSGQATAQAPLDPAKELNAAQKCVELGISTKQAESILHDGVDWEQKHEQRVKQINAEKRDGIYITPAHSPVVPTDASPWTRPIALQRQWRGAGNRLSPPTAISL